VLERAGDYLSRKTKQLGLEREETLSRAQKLLNEMYPDQARALSLNKQVLKIVTANASVASELRFRQVQILKRLGEEVKKLHIQIRG